MSLNNIGVDILKRNHQATYYLGVKIPPPPKQLHINLVRKRWFLDRGTFSAMHNNNETHLWTLVKTSFLACEKLFFGGGGSNAHTQSSSISTGGEDECSVLHSTKPSGSGGGAGKVPPIL